MTTTWRVMTWNILGAKDPDLGRLAAHIRERNPDVVALQEVRRSQARRLATRLGWRWVWGRKHYPYGPLVWWRAEGLAILSPTALSDRQRHTISVGEPMWIYRHRILLSATVTRGADNLRVHNTHLASDNPDHRIDQARRAARFIATDGRTPRVLCGDLNAPGEVEVLREFHAVGLRDPGGTVTNPSEAPVQRLDYVLLPDDATLASTDTPDGGEQWQQLSDHLPVVVEFTVSIGVEVARISTGDGGLLRRIRLAALADAPYAFGSTLESETSRSDEEWELRAALGSEGNDRATFFARTGADVVGLVGAYRENPTASTVELVSMWVAPHARGRHVGALLIDAATTWAVETGASNISLWVTRGNTPAERLYELCGFRPTGESQPLPSDSSRDEARMTLPL